MPPPGPQTSRYRTHPDHVPAAEEREQARAAQRDRAGERDRAEERDRAW